ncbi:MAG: histone deacetylase [Deltaproteobacteria bacterium]
MICAIVYHPDYLRHKTGFSHPESPDRLTAIMRRLDESGLLKKLILIEPNPAKEEDILLVHSKRYFETIKSAWDNGCTALTSDTPISEESYRIALLSAGGVLTGIDKIMAKEIDNGMALVRPPGHHATPDQAMGFCLFNNIAIGARYLQKKYGIAKVLIIDWDLHHGNGTQYVFYEDPSVLYFSTHQYPHYPGTGSANEKGEGKGVGFTINVPMRAGTPADEFMKEFRDTLYNKAIEFSPNFILISAGFDAHRDDPLGSLMLTEASYAEMTKIALDIANTCCKGRILSVLEGGYNLNALAMSVEAHLMAMMG